MARDGTLPHPLADLPLPVPDISLNMVISRCPFTAMGTFHAEIEAAERELELTRQEGEEMAAE